MASRGPRLRAWVGTINNPVGIFGDGAEEGDPNYVLPVETWNHVKHAVWQLEESSTGTPHYQIYVEFSAPMRLGAMRNLEGADGAHWERRAGTAAEAAAYCSKEDTRLEGPYYYPSEAWIEGLERYPKRTDLAAACGLIKQGASDKRLAEEVPIVYVKYHKGLNSLRNALNLNVRDGNQPTNVAYYLGPSGTGKSHRLFQECSGPEWYWVSAGKWFDGYMGQKGLVFDEFRDNWMPWRDLLRLVDNKPLQVEIKGGTVQMLATNFRFSSNIHPKHLYKNVTENSVWADGNPLRRRILRSSGPGIVYMLQPYFADGDGEPIEEEEFIPWEGYAGAPHVIIPEEARMPHDAHRAVLDLTGDE